MWIAREDCVCVSAVMGSYQLIKENINPHLQGNKCILRIEGRDDVESALSELDSSSSPILGRNAASRCIPSASGTTRLVSLDIFRGFTVAVTFHLHTTNSSACIFRFLWGLLICVCRQCRILIVAFRVKVHQPSMLPLEYCREKDVPFYA